MFYSNQIKNISPVVCKVREYKHNPYYYAYTSLSRRVDMVVKNSTKFLPSVYSESHNIYI